MARIDCGPTPWTDGPVSGHRASRTRRGRIKTWFRGMLIYTREHYHLQDNYIIWKLLSPLPSSSFSHPVTAPTHSLTFCRNGSNNKVIPHSGLVTVIQHVTSGLGLPIEPLGRQPPRLTSSQHHPANNNGAHTAKAKADRTWRGAVSRRCS